MNTKIDRMIMPTLITLALISSLLVGLRFRHRELFKVNSCAQTNQELTTVAAIASATGRFPGSPVKFAPGTRFNFTPENCQ